MARFKKKILIIDDDVDIVTLLKDTLEEGFFECETASTAAEALQKLETNKPNLIVLDLMLPGMSGFGLMRQLNQDANLKKTPIIILSALADDEIAQESLSLGAVGYLTKECKPKQLLSVIKEYA